jgi:CRP-like cAMP-binding protein
MKECAPIQENSHAAFDIIRSHGVLHTLPPNLEIFRQGQIIGGVYLLEKGEVKIGRTEYCGNDVVIEIAEPVQILGIASVLSLAPAAVTATTLTTCYAISVNTRLFLTLVEQNPDLAKSLLRLVSEYSCEQVIRHAWLGTASSRQRLASILLRYISPRIPHSNGKIRVHLPLKKSDIAGLLAVRPEQLSRLLAELVRKEVIEQERGRIHITNVEKLLQEAGGE